MNYLGHAFCSTYDTLLGNMAGDSMRGVDIAGLPRSIRDGLDLHFLIDRLTDTHPSFIPVTRLFSSRNLPYAGVLADIAADYVFASKWEEYSSVDWYSFKEEVYSRLLEGKDSVPGSFRYSAYWLVREDWFESYRTFRGMETAFYRLSRKTRREVDPAAARGVIEENEEAISSFAKGVLSSILSNGEMKSRLPRLISKPCISVFTS